ncbi:unnamed protein product [Dicrocoelium dendriticum]|nr:unnamed protein product [Dicrocoelium dendriticum]
MITSTCLLDRALTIANLLCVLSNSDELLFAVTSPKSTEVRVIWRKHIRADTVAFLRIIAHPIPHSITPNVGVVLAQQFQQTDCVLVSLYLFHCPTDAYMTSTHLCDVITVPLPRNPNASLTDLRPFPSTLFGSFRSRVSLLLFSPVCLSFALLDIFDSQKDEHLCLRLVRSWCIENSIQKWNAILSSYTSGDCPDHTVLSVHSSTQNCDLIGYVWHPDPALHRQDYFKFNIPADITGNCTLSLQQLVSAALNGSPPSVVISLLLELTRSSDCGTRVFLIIATLVNEHCFILRFIDILGLQAPIADTLWLLLPTPDDTLAQLVVSANVRSAGSYSELYLSAWPVNALLSNSEGGCTQPVSVFSSVIPADFTFCLFPFDSPHRTFSTISPILFVLWYNRVTSTFRMFSGL